MPRRRTRQTAKHAATTAKAQQTQLTEEQRQLRAEKARLVRQNAKQHMKDLESSLNIRIQEVETLKAEKEEKVMEIARLETLLSARQEQQGAGANEGGTTSLVTSPPPPVLSSETSGSDWPPDIEEGPSTSSHVHHQSAHTSSLLETQQEGTSLSPTASQETASTQGASKGKKSPRKRKSQGFLFQLPPQADPVLEAKRQRAVKARKNRQKAATNLKELQEELHSRKAEVEDLKKQKEEAEKRLEALQDQCDRIERGEASAGI